MKQKITLDQAVEWRCGIWSPAIQSALDKAEKYLPKDASVLEVGYNSGMMSCLLHQNYGWKITGYELEDSQKSKAELLAKNYGFEDEIDFRVCQAEDTLNIKGQYDAIFLKSVLYHNTDIETYKLWVKWLKSCLKDGGILIAIENGQGHFLDKLYRSKLANVGWKKNILFNSETEQIIREVFSDVEINYYGGISQYLASYSFSKPIAKLENKLGLIGANSSFVASIFAIK